MRASAAICLARRTTLSRAFACFLASILIRLYLSGSSKGKTGVCLSCCSILCILAAWSKTSRPGRFLATPVVMGLMVGLSLAHLMIPVMVCGGEINFPFCNKKIPWWIRFHFALSSVFACKSFAARTCCEGCVDFGFGAVGVFKALVGVTLLVTMIAGFGADLTGIFAG